MPGFTLEPGYESWVGRQMWGKPFDGNHPMQPGIPCPPHSCHPAGCELFPQFVAPVNDVHGADASTYASY